MIKNSTNKGKLIVLASTLLTFITGVTYTWSLFNESLINNFNWTSKAASIPYTILTISSSIGMILFGKVQDKKGPKFVSIIAGILMGIGFILSGIFISPVMLSITIGVFMGLGIGIINISTTPISIKWFPENIKGQITGIVVAGVGISSIFYSPLVNYLMNNFGLSKSFIYIGIFILISTISLASFISNPPENFNPNLSNLNKENRKNNKNYRWQEMLKTLDFYKLWIMFAFNSTAGLILITHISNISKIQVDWQGGFILVILVSLFNTLGRLLGGTLSDKLHRISFFRIIFILQGINMILFSKYNSIFSIIIGVAIGGFCYGSGFSAFPAALSDYYGSKHFSINYGFLFTAWSLGGVIGPMTGAMVFDRNNNYNLAYIIALGLLLFSILITLTFNKSEKN